MAKFKFKDEKETLQLKQETRFNKQERESINKLDAKFDENALAYEDMLSKMTAEERQAAMAEAKARLEEGYNDQLTRARGDAPLSDRQKKKILSQARDMANTTSKRVGEMRKKVDDFAKKHAETTKLNTSSIALYGLNNYKVDADASDEVKDKVKTLKKTAPKIYERYVRYANLYKHLHLSTRKDAGLIKFVIHELNVAKEEWLSVNKKIEKYAPVAISDKNVASVAVADEREDRRPALSTEFLMLDEEKWDDEREIAIKDNGDSFADEELVTGEIKNSLEKKDIDWDRDIEAEIRDVEGEKESKEAELKALNEGLKEKEASKDQRKQIKGLEKDIRDLERKINDLKIESYTKSAMQNIIDATPGPKPTMKEIEKTINNYLKEIGKNAEIKFRAKTKAVIGILNGCAICGNQGVYKDLLHMMYSQNTEIEPMGNLTFGYLGSKDVDGYIGKDGAGEGLLGNYGHVAIKLNKNKVKHRTGFLVGNSKENYSKQRSRGLDKPDILAAGGDLAALYERAKKIAAGEKMLSPEQEAKLIDGAYPYFECQIVGRVSSREIEEITYNMPVELPQDFESLKRIINSGAYDDLKDLYKQVNLINKHPDSYDRDGEQPLKLSVWGTNGVEIGYHELKVIFES